MKKNRIIESLQTKLEKLKPDQAEQKDTKEKNLLQMLNSKHISKSENDGNIFSIWNKDYTNLHNQMMKDPDGAKFVECVVINGWGNAIQEMISCFLFALQTKRAIIFNINGLGNKLIRII